MTNPLHDPHHLLSLSEAERLTDRDWSIRADNRAALAISVAGTLQALFNDLHERTVKLENENNELRDMLLETIQLLTE